MEVSQVITAKDFDQFLDFLVKTHSSDRKSLEEYLRTLWALIQQHESNTVSFTLIAKLLADAFRLQPLPFEESWLEYSAPPDEGLDDFEYLRGMVLYQIADLHLMAQAGTINNPHRYFGIDSPTGHRWYNFVPVDYLECAKSCSDDWEDAMSTECSWRYLALLLWVGQIYE